MKIAIPTDGNTLDTTVCVSFGRAPYFLFHDTVKNTWEFIENPAASETGGAGIKAAQTIVDHQGEVLLTPRCGENAAEVLTAAGIKLYKTTIRSVKESLEAHHQGDLPLLEEIHSGFHGHGGQ